MKLKLLDKAEAEAMKLIIAIDLYRQQSDNEQAEAVVRAQLAPTIVALAELRNTQ